MQRTDRSEHFELLADFSRVQMYNEVVDLITPSSLCILLSKMMADRPAQIKGSSPLYLMHELLLLAERTWACWVLHGGKAIAVNQNFEKAASQIRTTSHPHKTSRNSVFGFKLPK